MSYLLDGSIIRAPMTIRESNSTQSVQHRPLKGNYSRDYIGDNKRIWTLEYMNVKASDYTTIKTIYDSYLTTAAGKSWQVTETNYTVSATTVHIDLPDRDFRVKGTDYISDFTLILTEV